MTDTVKESRNTRSAARSMPVWKCLWQQYTRYLTENRASERKPSGVAAEVWWTNEDGARTVVRGVCVDISLAGVGLVCSTPVPDHKLLQVKLEPAGLVKIAHLRHCNHMGMGYLIGLQFC